MSAPKYVVIPDGAFAPVGLYERNDTKPTKDAPAYNKVATGSLIKIQVLCAKLNSIPPEPPKPLIIMGKEVTPEMMVEIAESIVADMKKRGATFA